MGKKGKEKKKEDKSQVSDGYHTFKELYQHRHELFCSLLISHPRLSWIAAQHEDGTMYEGWFIAGMELPTGQITYHMPLEPYFYRLKRVGVKFTSRAPKWDGHTSDQVLERLALWNS